MLTTPPLSLYVHLPWCVRKCPYCDFNSHEGRGPLPFDAYVDALLADLDYDLPLVWGRTIHSVFFGGGTPSLFPPEFIDRFLQAASSRLRSRSSKARDASWNRRVNDAAYSDGIGGRLAGIAR